MGTARFGSRCLIVSSHRSLDTARPTLGTSTAGYTCLPRVSERAEMRAGPQPNVRLDAAQCCNVMDAVRNVTAHDAARLTVP
eukprot:2823596-Prymnesium_polylepis.1